jgi:hypothetical protein
MALRRGRRRHIHLAGCLNLLTGGGCHTHMNTSNYHLLSAPARRAARKLAKKLLKSVPAEQNEIDAGWLRGVLGSSYMRPENVFAAFTFVDDAAAWHAAVILQKADKLVELNWSSPTGSPCCQQALRDIKRCIAAIKGTREHPAMQQFRDAGIQPDQLEILDVYHPAFGCRCFLMTDQQIEVHANHYVDFLKENEIRFGEKCLALAQGLVVDLSPQLSANKHFFLWDTRLEDLRSLAFHAAGFLLKYAVEVVCDDEYRPNDLLGVPFDFNEVRHALSPCQVQA